MHLLAQRQLWPRLGRQSELGGKEGANDSPWQFRAGLHLQGTMSDSDGEIDAEKNGGSRDGIIFES
jgi:hypothetical protein